MIRAGKMAAFFEKNVRCTQTAEMDLQKEMTLLHKRNLQIYRNV